MISATTGACTPSSMLATRSRNHEDGRELKLTTWKKGKGRNESQWSKGERGTRLDGREERRRFMRFFRRGVSFAIIYAGRQLEK